jgi:hypothetical protein
MLCTMCESFLLCSFVSRAGCDRCNRRMLQALEISERHAYEFEVRAGIERNLDVVRQPVIDVDGNAVQCAEGRHGPDFAIGENVGELRFGDDDGGLNAGGPAQGIEVHMPGSGDDGHGHLAVELDHDSLGDLFPGDVGERCDGVRGESSRVGYDDVVNVVGVEEVFKLRAWHMASSEAHGLENSFGEGHLAGPAFWR